MTGVHFDHLELTLYVQCDLVNPRIKLVGEHNTITMVNNYFIKLTLAIM